MPDILIRGMEMPKSCADCHDADLPTAIAWLEAKCPCAYGMNKQGVYDLRHKRHPDCPLVELPEHGDLIDRDALGEFPFNMSFCDGYEADEWVQNAPAIVPASKSKEETA